MDDAPTRVTCIVLAYGEEPLLRRCVESILASREVSADVVLVDNGCFNPDIADVGRLAGVTLLKPHVNLGFAAGANLGARSGRGDLLAFVNSDAVVEPDALHEFAKALRDPMVGLVTGSIRLMAQPGRINSCGNPSITRASPGRGGWVEPPGRSCKLERSRVCLAPPWHVGAKCGSGWGGSSKKCSPISRTPNSVFAAGNGD